MNFVLSSPSLEQKLSVKIAIALWSQDDFRGLQATSFDFLKDNWQDIEDVVEENASKLSLPPILKKRLLDNIRPIGLQILSWIEFHTREENRFINELTPARFFWTLHGTIDYMRTAELLIKDDNLSVEQRFKLACFYCLVDDISDLKDKYCSIGRIDNDFFISFWLNYLKDNDDIRRRQLIRGSVRQFPTYGNETAIRYFFPKMDTESGELLISTASDVAYLMMFNSSYLLNARCTILNFLLSTMNVEQQAHMFKSHFYGVLKSFLIWPRQSQLLEAIKDKWSFLPEWQYYSLLKDIIDRMSCKQNDFNELFGEFWHQSPETHKQRVMRHNGIDRLLLALRKVKDENNIQLLMKYSSYFNGKTSIL